MLEKYKVYRYDHFDSPAVTAGQSAVLIGLQSGLFTEMGYTLPGEMGGLWAGEKKLCDGLYLAIDDVPLLACDAYEAHPVCPAFHYRMAKEQMHIVRRQVVPDGMKGVVIELTVENLRDTARMVEISFTVRTDILTVTAAKGEDDQELGRDVGEFDEKTQAFYARDSRNPWHIVWGAENGQRVLAHDMPKDIYGFGTKQGKGVNGRLFYRLRVKGGEQSTIRLMIAGTYASRTKAEEMLEQWRSRAGVLMEEKEARIQQRLSESCLTLPYERLVRCWNWAKVYYEWLTGSLPNGGEALCMDLTEQPQLFGKNWAKAVEGLLPLSNAGKVENILRTLVRISSEGKLAPGRVARAVSAGGKILQTGGAAESAQFVSLVYQTIRWSGNSAFAVEMLPELGLCMNYLRRSTRGFTDIQPGQAEDIRSALESYCGILHLVDGDASAYEQILSALPAVPEEDTLPAAAAEQTVWHGKRDHVEQMAGCLERMARRSLPGLPGALHSEEDVQGVLLSAHATAEFILPMTRYLFGIDPDACAKKIRFTPHTPIGWDGWKLEKVSVGSAVFTFESVRVSPSHARYSVSCNEPGWKLVTLKNGKEEEQEIAQKLEMVLGD